MSVSKEINENQNFNEYFTFDKDSEIVAKMMIEKIISLCFTESIRRHIDECTNEFSIKLIHNLVNEILTVQYSKYEEDDLKNKFNNYKENMNSIGLENKKISNIVGFEDSEIFNSNSNSIHIDDSFILPLNPDYEFCKIKCNKWETIKCPKSSFIDNYASSKICFIPLVKPVKESVEVLDSKDLKKNKKGEPSSIKKLIMKQKHQKKAEQEETIESEGIEKSQDKDKKDDKKERAEKRKNSILATLISPEKKFAGYHCLFFI